MINPDKINQLTEKPYQVLAPIAEKDVETIKDECTVLSEYITNSDMPNSKKLIYAYQNMTRMAYKFAHELNE